MSDILQSTKSPEQWAAIFAERGFKISTRQLRADARKLNACFIYGKAMFLSPEYVDTILAKATSVVQARKTKPIREQPLIDEKVMKHLKRCRNKNKPTGRHS